MEFVSGLALVLLTLVGYSSGAVLGVRHRTPVPNLMDLVIIIALWAGALVTRPVLGRWPALAVWLAAGLLVGAVLAYLRRAQYGRATAADPVQGSIFQRAWEAWKGFARRMGNYQSRVMMAYLYFTVVLPFGLAVTGLSDPLHIKRTGQSSTWQTKHVPVKPSVEEAGRQF